MNIYIGNLSFEVTEADLHNAFSGFGEVASVRVITDQYSGKSKGFGFVEMPVGREAEAAIESLNSSELKGRAIKVGQAKPSRGGSRGNRDRQGNSNRRRY
jgi:RNA recognition motif-containing protein